MIKNRTDDRLRVVLADGRWSTEFKTDAYGMSVRLFDGKDELKTFIRFKPHDVMAILEFLEDQTSRWDRGEI